MELIQNKDVGKFTSQKEKFCSMCCNRGTIKVVMDCDREKFEQEFDKLDNLGTLGMDRIYEVAISKCAYTKYYCPRCEEGQKYASRYAMYTEG